MNLDTELKEKIALDLGPGTPNDTKFLIEKRFKVTCIDKEEKSSEEIPEEILKLVEQRKIAREEKNWEESDRLRDEINNLGYSIKDTKNGIEIERKN